MKARNAFLPASALFLFSQLTFAAPTTALPEWTMLVYLNGHNNLDEFGEFNINQMEEIGSTSKVQVLVQWASLRNRTTKRLFIEKDQDTAKVTSPVVEDMRERVDMGKAQSLEDFINWGMKNYPSKHTFVVVWNHGSGWRTSALGSKGRPDPLQTREISWDDVSGNYISTEQMGRVLERVAKRSGKRIDVVGTDACLMAMAEVVGEFAHAANYFVGSQELEPGYGWPYAEILGRWNALQEASPAQVSKTVVEAYKLFYLKLAETYHIHLGATLSALELKQWPEFVAAAKDFAMSTLTWSRAEKYAALEAAREAQHYTYTDYVDLGDWLELLPFARRKRLKNALGRLVIANRMTSGYGRAQGLTMWLPQEDPTMRKHLTRYEHLVWDQQTLWSAISQEINFPDLLQ